MPPTDKSLRPATARRARSAAILLALIPALPHAAAAQRSSVRLDTVAVVASRTGARDATRSVDVVTRAEIARTTARTVADVLRMRLGVDVDDRSPAQADLSLRGSSPEQVLVLVDGVRVSDAQSAHYALDLAVPLSSVERIEILRGAGSAAYGPDAVGGVINIVTGAPGGAKELALRGGGFGSVGGEASLATRGSVPLTTSASFEKSDGHRAGTDYRRGEARASLSARAGAGQLRTTLGAAVRDFGAADFYAPYNSIERTGATTLDSRWTAPVGDWALSLGAGTRRHTDRYTLVRDDPSLYQNYHESWQTSGELVARTLRGPVALAIGGDGAHDQLSSARLGGRREWRAGAFAEGVLGGGSAATLSAGLRGDRSSTFGSFFSPSLAGSWQPVAHLRLRATGSRAFRAPTWTERYYTDPSNSGDPTLLPERFWSGEAGLAASLGGLTIDAAAFTRVADGLIDWVRPAGSGPAVPWQATNVGTATFRGVEARIEAEATHGVRYSIFGSGLTLSSSQGAGLDGKYALRPLTRKLGASASAEVAPGVEAGLEVIEAQRAREEAYATGNLRLAVGNSALRATLDLVNLANARWLDASGMPGAGRALYVGVGWTAGATRDGRVTEP